MRFNGTVRRQLTGTVTAVAAMAALTASQAPDFVDAVAASREGRAAPGTDDVVWSEVPGDDSYHTELPPLVSPEPPAPLKPPKAGESPSPPIVAPFRSEAAIPATVLAAYRKAERSLLRTAPGCRLPWQLLAAIGKVESGQASGGRVDAHGTTLTPILGPALDGVGFALIRDTDNGVYDGDRTYDRAVGPMQFIPSTWVNWAKDGNGDGRKDPNNIYDAALAAGHYLCAGGRDLTVRADLDRAILSYNRSGAYLRTVLSWLEFYRAGAHPVADGQGCCPSARGRAGRTGPRRRSAPAPRPVRRARAAAEASSSARSRPARRRPSPPPRPPVPAHRARPPPRPTRPPAPTRRTRAPRRPPRTRPRSHRPRPDPHPHRPRSHRPGPRPHSDAHAHPHGPGPRAEHRPQPHRSRGSHHPRLSQRRPRERDRKRRRHHPAL